MKKAPVGTEVFIKKHAMTVRDPIEVKRTVVEVLHLRVRGHPEHTNIKARLDTGEVISFGELTELPCSTMECGNCLYHSRKIGPVDPIQGVLL